MKKKLLAIVLAVMMVFALAACSSGSGGTNTGTSSSGGNTPADTTKYEFVVINHDAATSMGEKYMETLFNQISEDSGGRLVFNYNPGASLFGPTESLDAIKDGAADITWTTTAFYSGIFPLAEFINLPTNGVNSARMGSDVLQAMYDEIPEVKAEYDAYHVIALHACTYSPVSTVKKKIEKPADFKGMNIRAAGTIPSMYLNALGATAISMPTNDVYEALEKGVVDGMANDWHNIDCFKLYQVIDYCLDAPVNETACMVLMNKAKYESLPDDLKALLDKYTETDYAGDMAGYWWDSCNFWVADEMRDNGVDVYQPSKEVSDFMYSDAIKQQMADEYIKYLDGLGLDGKGFYDKFKAIVARYAPNYTDPYAEEFNYLDWDLSQVDGYKGNQL